MDLQEKIFKLMISNGREAMQIESIENAVLLPVNPILKSIIKRFDIQCKQDGSLLINSLKRFLGEDVELCKALSAFNTTCT